MIIEEFFKLEFWRANAHLNLLCNAVLLNLRGKTTIIELDNLVRLASYAWTISYGQGLIF